MGASYITTIFGVIMIIGDIGKLVADSVTQSGIPTDLAGWIQFGTVLAGGVGLILTKAWNVSNSKDPAAATVVSTKSEAKANPAEAKP